MPLYEYECEACGHRFEVIQKFSDAPVDKCPSCGSKVRKLQSAPAFQFKGSGWYVTDYAKTGSAAETKASKDGRKADQDAESKSEGQSEGKADRKESSSSTSDTTSSSEKASSTPPSAASATGSTPSTSSTGSSTTKSGD
jgi:putative FmdB family regulatory protein